MTRTFKLALLASVALATAGGAASAQTSGQSNQDRLGAVFGALIGDRLGISAMDQAWLRGGRPLADAQAQFTSRVDASQRSGSISTSASTRLRTDYQALVALETQYADGGFSTQERADLNSRYTALVQTLDSGAAGYGDASVVAQGRADFETRVDAAANAQRITRTQATQLKTDYQTLIQTEAQYAADGTISTTERADLDARLDALDARIAGTATQTPATPADARTRLSALDTAVTTAERAGSLSRADAASARVQLGDLARLEAAYRRVTPLADDTAYLTRRLGELEAAMPR